MPTIRDVAKMAGVSVSTASLTFNHPSRVADNTRKRVLEVAQRLQYRPTGAARDLRSRRTDMIAVLLRDLSGPFYSELIQGVQDEADRCEYSVVIAHSNRRDAIDRLLYENRVDGAILLDPAVSDETVMDLAAQGMPMVILDRNLSHPNLMAISADHEHGAYEATHFLVRAGYRRILFLAGPESSLDAELRFQGYQRALQDACIPVPLAPLRRGDFTEASGIRETEQLLQTRPWPDVIFAANDEMALGVLSVLRTRHIRVPDEVAVMGFDDIRVAQYVEPALTTVRQPMYELGQQAMLQLLRKLSGQKVTSRIVLKTQLLIRNSTRHLSEHY
jgi:LacI family transcriptional regulator